MTKAVKWIMIATILATTGAWAQFGNLLKVPAIDTKEFDELNAKIDTVKLKYDEGTAQIFQAAEVLFQFVDQHHTLPSLSNTWPTVVKALNDAKTKEQQKIAREGLSTYLNELQARRAKCDTIWSDIQNLSTLKRLLSGVELQFNQVKADADSGITKDRQAIQAAAGLISQTSDAVTSLAGQLKKNPLAAVKIGPLLSKLKLSKDKINEIVKDAPDQVKVGEDLIRKVIALFAAP